jgi:hypothetical protein
MESQNDRNFISGSKELENSLCRTASFELILFQLL